MDTTNTALAARLAALNVNSSQADSSPANTMNSTSRPELPAWNPPEMYASASSVALNIRCPQVMYGIDVEYKPGDGPSPMNAAKHGQFPVPYSNKHTYFCACVWERISPPTGEIWTPEARMYLAILWFHTDLHKETIVTWEEAEWEEADEISMY